jgi:hypothetical protein
MKALLLLALCACTTVNDKWTDGTTIAVVVETSASEASAQAFKSRIERDIGLWNTGLQERGCAAPFTYTEDPSQAYASIVLRDKSNWPFTGSIGARFTDVIYILSEGDGTLDSYVADPMWIVGLHELGHAMGLDHSVYADSVMQDDSQPITAPLSRRDISNAALTIGCVSQ